MFPGNKAIKQTALASLSTVWSQCFAIAFVVFLMSVIPQLIYQGIVTALGETVSTWLDYGYSVAVFFFNLFVTYPLLLGIFHWFWIVTTGEKASLALCFYYFSSKREYASSLRLSWTFAWRIGLLQIVAYIPDTVKYLLDLLPQSLFNDFLQNLIYIGSSAFILVITILIFVFTVLPLLPLPATIVNYRHDRFEDNIKEAKLISKGLQPRFIGFFITLLGWALLTLFVIPMLFTVPYFFACYAVLMRFAIHHQSKKFP